MKVGCCSLKFTLYGNRSLKDKRRIVRAIKDRVKNKFNISIAEVGEQDVWQSLHLGIAAVSSDAKYLDGLMNQVIDFIDRMHLAELIDSQVELIHLGSSFKN